MTIKRFALAAAALSMLAAVGAAQANAQVGVSADLNATTNLNGSAVNASSNVGVKATTTNKSTMNKASSSAANASATAKANASSKSAVAATASSTAAYNTLNGSTSSSTGTTTNANSFSITRRDLAASTTSYISASNVTTSEDFQAYSRGLMMADENISKIEASDGQVSIWYREPAKFLGVVPVTVSVHASVTADGTVTVAYPWWYELFVKDDTQTQFQTDLTNTAGTLARGEATTTLSSSAKARLVNALQSIMKTKYQSVEATSSAETY